MENVCKIVAANFDSLALHLIKYGCGNSNNFKYGIIPVSVEELLVFAFDPETNLLEIKKTEVRNECKSTRRFTKKDNLLKEISNADEFRKIEKEIENLFVPETYSKCMVRIRKRKAANGGINTFIETKGMLLPLKVTSEVLPSKLLHRNGGVKTTPHFIAVNISKDLTRLTQALVIFNSCQIVNRVRTVKDLQNNFNIAEV